MLQVRLLWIELHKYKLLEVSSIQTIKIDFRERFHWILGSNGSGKSSIIKECTPLDFEPRNFDEGGYKKTAWLVGNQEYLLISKKGVNKSTHSFLEIKDGSQIEKNIGGTSKVQRSLVEEVFRETKETQNVKTGKIRLTRMDAGERKSLYTSLSSVDYTYALGYYKRLYTSYRDLLGSRKIDHSRLVELKTLNSDTNQESVTLEEIKNLKSQIDFLMNMRPKVSLDSSNQDLEINSLNAQIKSLKEKTFSTLFRNKQSLPLLPLHVLKEEYSKAELNFQLNEEIMDNVYRSFEKMSGKIEDLVKTTGLDRNELENRREATLEELDLIRYEIISNDTNLSPLSEIIEKAYGEYVAIRDEMFPLDPEEISEFTRYRTTLSSLKEEHRRLSSNIEHINDSLSELKSHEHKPNTECPECGHLFNPAFSNLKKRNLEESLEKELNSLKSINAKIDEAYSNVLRMEAYLKGQELWGNLIRRYPELNDLWGAAIKEKLNHLDAFAIDPLFEKFRLDLQTRVKEKKLLEVLKSTQDKLHWLDKVSQSNLAESMEEVKKLQKRLDDLEGKRIPLLENLVSLKNQLALSVSLTKSVEEAERLQKLLGDKLIEKYDLLEHTFINDLIRGLDKEISIREDKLRNMYSKTSEILRLEKLISESDGRLSVLKDALTILSPSEGLIAKGLTGFINHFTGLMNSIIERIMTYPMKIQPLVMDSDNFDLDFKLPILVKDVLAEDVSECSTGQCEIIDLAFKILYMKFKGIDGGLLPLDEFGSNLDHTIQSKAYETVKGLLTTTNFSQVLVISHMSSTYGLMEDASITMLCPINVHMPEGVSFNDTTKITYF